MESHDVKIAIKHSLTTDKTELNSYMLWKAVSKPLTPFELEVCKSQIEVVNNKCTISLENYDYYGDEFYEIIRPKFLMGGEQVPLLQFIDTTKYSKTIAAQNLIKSNSKHLKTADRIKYDNTIRILNENLSSKKNLFNTINFTIPTDNIMNSRYLELRAIGYYYMAWFLMSNKDIIGDNIHLIYGIIISIQRFIKTITNNHISLGYSSKSLEDLNLINTLLITTFKFNGSTLYNKTPSLIENSPFDKYIPNQKVKPYEHQIQIVKLLNSSEYMKSGFLTVYNTMTNSGKTFTIIGLAEQARIHKQRGVPYLEIIFACSIQSVKNKVGQILYNNDIPIGLGLPVSSKMKLKKGIKEDYIIKNSNNTSKDGSNRVVIICSPDVAVKILENHKKLYNSDPSNIPENKYILFVDEITINAENFDSKELNDNMTLLSMAPKWTILSNANLVADARIEPFIATHRRSFVNSQLLNVSSNVIYGCCSVKTFEKQSMLPHYGCTTVSQLTKAIQSIKENPFLGKMYNPPVVQVMYNNIKKFIEWSLADEDDDGVITNTHEIIHWTQKLPNITKIFNDVSSINADNIRKIAITLLEVMAEFYDDYMISKICSIPQPDKNDVSINLMNLNTSQFQNMNLIATPTPEILALSMFSNLIINIKSKIGSLNKIHSTFESKMMDWNKKYEKLENIYKKEDDLSRARDELQDERPSLDFPEEFQINTKSYMLKYLKLKDTDFSTKFRIPLHIEDIDITNMNASEDLILLLYAGVGVYVNPDNTNLNAYYLETVLELASAGRLEFLITDASICYGTDFPIGCIFITPEFSNSVGLNTLFQLQSRAGRGRMSYMAQIYMDIKSSLKILDYINGGDSNGDDDCNNEKKYGIELDNMIRKLQQIIS